MKEKSTKRRNAIIAAIAGAALLMGGTTYALWSSSASLDGGTITAGDLEIVADTTTTLQVFDVSTDRTDTETLTVKAFGKTTPIELQGHVIDSETAWNIVPGDTVALAFPYQLTLKGDNLLGKLSIAGDKLVNAAEENFQTEDKSANNLTLKYGVIGVDGTSIIPIIPSTTAVTNENLDGGLYQAPNQPSGQPEVAPVMVGQDGTIEVVVMLYVTFNDVSGTTDVNSVLDLSAAMTATLTQVRCGDGKGETVTCTYAATDTP